MSGIDIVVRAVRTIQGDGVPVFAFFLPGADITRIADISRVSRDEADALRGFQRREVREHVNSIVEFLDSGPVLFPNAIILALGPEVEFRQSRGPTPAGMEEDSAQAGTLTLPMRPEGRRVAWVVDGQQRSLALARAHNARLPVPVVGFVSSDLKTQREQFILVNKVRPLPRGLLNELLPEVGALLPRDLAARKLPSELCYALNRDPGSPFYGLVRRESEPENLTAVVTDTALTDAIRDNLKPPMGALSQYRNDQGSDAEAMYRTLVLYWDAVRAAFPDAWGRPPQESRLMHSAGIKALARLMDQVMLRADSVGNPQAEAHASLRRLAPHCRWTEGVWEGLGWAWDEVQNTSRHISRLTEHLVRLDRELSRPQR
ncbi:DGQHR domain-containing protein DpdB [Azospirillum isscasi]|uniref:DGQHR domain-containing protein DpdB n=1 Tax=Azospirillum isscasi TaxID=3053926 RepID=A0ABU0WDB4_9PROT|nr:DGQHR domain-containing protein DpdB [Azospirillum isscasi]MDQ2102179.1 DGQHR domain-containing protein DpdB [Azospirillum isscasi]